VAENNTGTRIYTIKSREAKRKLRIMVFENEGILDGPRTNIDKDGNETTILGGSCGVGDESEDKKTDYHYESVDVIDGSETDIFKIISGEDKIKQDEEEKQKREESKKREEAFWKNLKDQENEMWKFFENFKKEANETKNLIDEELKKARKRGEKCSHCGKKITNSRITFYKNGKFEGPYCSKKCSETSTFSDQKIDNQSATKSVIKKGIAFFGLIGILPLIITALTIYLLNKKSKVSKRIPKKTN
jgi:hypothetical protein